MALSGLDGPLALFVTAQLAPHLLGPVAVAAFTCLALMPKMQERMTRLLPANEKSAAGMAAPRKATKTEKIAFPVFMAIIFNLFFPPVAPLITLFMLGNLLREVEAAGRLIKNAGGITDAIVLILAVAIGSTMAADTFLTVQTGEIVVLGLVAFACIVASTNVMARFTNLLLAEAPVNPMMPIAGRAFRAADRDHPETLLIHHDTGPHLAGVFGAAIFGGIMLLALGVH